MNTHRHSIYPSQPFEVQQSLQVSHAAREFFLGDELLLFSISSGSLFRVNPISALIWDGLRDGLKWQDLIELLCEAFDLNEGQAAHDLEQLVSQWIAHGLLASDSFQPILRPGQSKKINRSLDYPQPIPPRDPNIISFRYRLLNNRIHLCLPGIEEAFRIHPMLAHLEVVELSDCNLHLEVRRGSNYYLLLCDGAPIDWCSDERGVAPMVHANLHLLTYERSDHLIGMHAAAVADNNNCILLPANCGSGKSTLTAALVGSGFQYCSDDMVFLTPEPVRVRPAPMAMGIKSGSWNLLEKYYPQLLTLASHERADGKVIRYLPPPTHACLNQPSTSLAVTHILFPGYREGEKATVTRLTPAQGLTRITQAGYDVQGGLNEACVKQLVTWIAGIPCYEFHFGNLDDAVVFLKAFLR